MIGQFDPTGGTIAFRMVVGDCAEVWVGGRLLRNYTQSGGSVIGGWNSLNRLIVAQISAEGIHF